VAALPKLYQYQYLVSRLGLGRVTARNFRTAVQSAKSITFHWKMSVWESEKDVLGNEVRNMLQLQDKCGKFATLQNAILITLKNENKKWTQYTQPSLSSTTWLEETFSKSWGVRHKMLKFISKFISFWDVKAQPTTGPLKTGKYTLTKTLYDVHFRNEQSGLYARRIERRGGGSLLQGGVTFNVRQTCGVGVNVANFVRNCISW
jgi:hypothetical protein